MLELGLDDLFELPAIGADLLEQRPHDAVRLRASSAASRCSGSICGLPALGGQLLRALRRLPGP